MEETKIAKMRRLEAYEQFIKQASVAALPVLLREDSGPKLVASDALEYAVALAEVIDEHMAKKKE